MSLFVLTGNYVGHPACYKIQVSQVLHRVQVEANFTRNKRLEEMRRFLCIPTASELLRQGTVDGGEHGPSPVAWNCSLRVPYTRGTPCPLPTASN